MSVVMNFLRRASSGGPGAEDSPSLRQDPMIEEASASAAGEPRPEDEEITIFSSPSRELEAPSEAGSESGSSPEEAVPKMPDFEEEEEVLSSFCEGNELFFTYIPDKVVAAINAGGGSIPGSSFGVDFVEDVWHSGGDVLRTGEEIVDAQEPLLYKTARYGEVTYSLDGLEPGDYFVDVHFAEIIFTNGPPGMRIFDVFVQDEKVVSELDVYGRVGSNRPLILLNVRAAVNNRVLTVAFRGVVGNPTISAICVHKAPPLAKRVSQKTYEPVSDCYFNQFERRLTPIKERPRAMISDSEQRIEELKNECHQAWISVQEANRQAEKLREELAVKSLTVDTLANAVEGQVLELRDLREKESLEKSKLQQAVLEAQKTVQEIKTSHGEIAKDAKECICSMPDPSEMISAVQSLINEQNELKRKFLQESQERKSLYNKLIELRGNVRVFCRCRPLNASELAAASMSVVEFDSAKENELVIRCGNNPKKLFKFDRVFTPEDDQAEVFADTLPVVTSVLDGYNVCIFAYGQTGTGKTFTMEGTPENRGVNYRTLEELFRLASLRDGENKYGITVSVMEVYNEQIRDLLSAPPQLGQASKKLEIKQDADGGHHVPGLEEAEVQSMDEVWEVLQTGSRARTIGATNANEHSSRSHCMLSVKVRGENLITGEFTRSKLWLVDLAGSERVAKTDVQGDRLKEAQNINKSLAALGDVIHALTTKSSHVPYRNSKLTHLLQDSLGGDSKTLMFVQISPSEYDAGESLCSLNFASRVRGVEMGPAKKQLDSSEFFKYKQMAEKAKSDVKTKDDALRRLEEGLRSTENKLKTKEQLCQSLMEKVKDRDRVAAELELQLATEKKARVAAEAALREDKRSLNNASWDRLNAEEALEAALRTAAGIQQHHQVLKENNNNSNRPPLQERPLENMESVLKPPRAPGLMMEEEALSCSNNENMDPQQQQSSAQSALRKLQSSGRLKPRFNSPPLMSSVARRSGRPSLCIEPGGIDVPATLSRMRNHHRRVQFSSPLMRSREKLVLAAAAAAAGKKEVENGGAAGQKSGIPQPGALGSNGGSRMRRMSLVGRAWSRGVAGGGPQRIPSGRKPVHHQLERGWNKGGFP